MLTEQDINIFIYTHKDFQCPVSNPLYRILTESDLKNLYPLQQYDVRTGDNIQQMGSIYSELKGHYWVWKNIKDLPQYVGFCHYRRFYPFLDRIPGSLMDNYRAIIFEPKPLTFNNEQVSIRKQYTSVHNIKDLEQCRNIVGELYPDYLDDFDNVVNNSGVLYSFNSFIMNRDDYTKYMEWLFSILFRFDSINHITCQQDAINLVKKRGNWDKHLVPAFINSVEYQARVDGFLAERLMTIYMVHNFGDDIGTVSLFDMVQPKNH